MKFRVSRHLLPEIRRDISNKKYIVGVFNFDETHDEKFRFFSSNAFDKSWRRKSFFGVERGAIAGYYFRLNPVEDFVHEEDLYFDTPQDKVKLKVYSNDTCILRDSYPYTEAIAFPKSEIRRGISDMIKFVNERSKLGIARRLNANQIYGVEEFITEDLHTGVHTKKAMEYGQINDAIHGLSLR
ncbi:hypothetical protein KW787_03090 [Candidatus Pacearchaeota archaeon]|nr:hypothetical protein [Candidatus Pacearchaeota archaeon]